MCTQCLQALSFRPPLGSSSSRSTTICAPRICTKTEHNVCSRACQSHEGKTRSTITGPQLSNVRIRELVNNQFGERSHCDVDCRCSNSWHKGRRNVFAVVDCCCHNSRQKGCRNVFADRISAICGLSALRRIPVESAVWLWTVARMHDHVPFSPDSKLQPRRRARSG